MRRAPLGLVLLAVALGAGACTGGTAYVGVYGPPVYGPGPWGPYGGPYGPRGPYGPGGVWVGVPVCCDEEDQDRQQPQDQDQQQEQRQEQEQTRDEEQPQGQGAAPLEGWRDPQPDVRPDAGRW